MLQSVLATATGAVAVALADAVGHGVAVVVGVAVAVAVAEVVGVADVVGAGRLCLLWPGRRGDSLVADTACVVPAAASDVAGAAAAGVDVAGVDVAGAAAAGSDVAGAAVAGVDVAGAAAAGAAVAGADVAGAATVAGEAHAPCAERLRLPFDPPINFKPRIKPTTSARASGTATRAARALCGHTDQCALRI